MDMKLALSLIATLAGLTTVGCGATAWAFGYYVPATILVVTGGFVVAHASLQLGRETALPDSCALE
jgi:hypothetical protein